MTDKNFRQVMHNYLHNSIVQEECRSKKHKNQTVILETRRYLSDQFRVRTLDNAANPASIFEICQRLELQPDQQAEIFQRLILSVVGFTGCTLEWGLLSLCNYGKIFPIDHYYVYEILRKYNPIWRLDRTLCSEIKFGDKIFTEGSRIIALLPAIHLSDKLWIEPENFLPDRWNISSTKKSQLFSFGFAPSPCPARAPAITFLSYALKYVNSTYDLNFEKDVFAMEIYGTFRSCPRGTLHAKSRQEPH
ncbi:cytochrome P450 [Corynebacterium epidermidicanis]|nr:cytochrome P450 [Corynebacterium epidermidicanis]